ncbi:MAG: uracil-DNA glycosylase [Deltaproteobacteria bacterium]|nr:uracil-DNA glycosylase [Deltaproteobacteria bacterium]
MNPRVQPELADLARDLAETIRALQVRGHAAFGLHRLPPPPAPALPPTTAPPPVPAPSPVSAPLPRDLGALAAEAEACRRCGLAATRSRVVFGDGAGTAGLLLIGEGPGRTEDEQGKPFVGPAGRLLDRILTAAGLDRGALYITNVVKCRPPGNRDPAPEEIVACRPFLDRQLQALAPRLVVAMGRPAAQSLLRTTRPLSALRGRVHARGGIPLLVTFHPAYLLRSPGQKALAWSDWRRVRDLLGLLTAGERVRIDGEEVPA